MAHASYGTSARAMALGAQPLDWFCAAQWPTFSPPLTDDLLTAYLRDPEAVFAGTSMPDPDLENERVIAELVRILAALSHADLRD